MSDPGDVDFTQLRWTTHGKVGPRRRRGPPPDPRAVAPIAPPPPGRLVDRVGSQIQILRMETPS